MHEPAFLQTLLRKSSLERLRAAEHGLSPLPRALWSPSMVADLLDVPLQRSIASPGHELSRGSLHAMYPYAADFDLGEFLSHRAWISNRFLALLELPDKRFPDLSLAAADVLLELSPVRRTQAGAADVTASEVALLFLLLTYDGHPVCLMTRLWFLEH